MKVTIKGIVKENREDLLVDKIVKSLLDDTEYRLYHRFMGEIVCELIFPMFNGPKVYDKVEIKDFKNAFNNYTDNDTVIQFHTSLGWNKYMDSNYGITNMFTLSRIGVRYYNTLFERILNDFENFHYTPDYGPVNESVENKEDLLVDKISQFMLDDTEYEFIPTMERVIIFYPFYTIENYYSTDKVLPILLKRGYDLDFVNYVQSTYSIKDWNLITNISQRYYSLLYDKVKELLGSSNNPMNESVKRKEDTLNKIVDFMVQDTTWLIFMDTYGDDGSEHVRVEITFPSGDTDEFPMDEMDVDWEQFFMNESDRDYLEEQFGITERWITQELYNRYIKKLRPIIYEEMVNYNR